MKNVWRVFLLLILLTSFTLIGCEGKSQIRVLKSDEVLNTQDRVIKSHFDDWTSTLEKLSYSYSIDSEEMIIALVFKNKDKWVYREYKVKNGETLELKNDEGQLCYISLPANRTIAYSWSMLNAENPLKPEDVTYDEWIRIPFKNERNVEGENYDRQVFDLSKGKRKLPITIQYKHNTEIREDIFEFVIKRP